MSIKRQLIRTSVFTLFTVLFCNSSFAAPKNIRFSQDENDLIVEIMELHSIRNAANPLNDIGSFKGLSRKSGRLGSVSLNDTDQRKLAPGNMQFDKAVSCDVVNEIMMFYVAENHGDDSDAKTEFFDRILRSAYISCGR